MSKQNEISSASHQHTIESMQEGHQRVIDDLQRRLTQTENEIFRLQAEKSTVQTDSHKRGKKITRQKYITWSNWSKINFAGWTQAQSYTNIILLIFILVLVTSTPQKALPKSSSPVFSPAHSRSSTSETFQHHRLVKTLAIYIPHWNISTIMYWWSWQELANFQIFRSTAIAWHTIFYLFLRCLFVWEYIWRYGLF